ncbi:dTDP-4-dehydrorhamnose reductase [Chryseolinea serpens]|uniref:dTDP-4-dehydrorhamnose reductase n=1 Tax=Chryseolinea serpens TaxID=947013 RepID=A0A1M5RXH3_9BACT|nr:SDR family oxidoreductase [Chryseolinea serpens]SHH30881.1 dTDP-4-dehydrorhamnose reductase [Chryseolinea serpens]
MKILVTGANGLLGSKLMSLLQRDTSIELYATARRASIVPLPADRFFLAELTDASAVLQMVAAVRPDVIIHTAAMTQVDQCEQDKDGCWKANVDAVGYLLVACEKYNIHFIHLSTDFIFDGSHGPLDETAQPNPVNFYGESKLAAERLVQESNVPWTIIRTVLVYGITPDMSRSNIIVWVKKNLEEGKTLQVVNDQWRTPTLAEDLAQGCYLAALKKATGIFHVSGKDGLTPYEMALHTVDFFQLDASLIKETNASQFTQPARRPQRTGFIIDKARTILGYEPHSFQEGLAVVAGQLKR